MFAAAVEPASAGSPEEASSVLTPQSAADEAVLTSRGGLSPAATSRTAALSGPDAGELE